MSLAVASNLAVSMNGNKSRDARSVIQRSYCDVMLEHDPKYHELNANLREFKDLEYDWDDEEGQPASDKSLELVKTILSGYAATAISQGLDWIHPSITVLNNGSISLYWNANSWQVYLTIPRSARNIITVVKKYGYEAISINVPSEKAKTLVDSISQVLTVFKLSR